MRSGSTVIKFASVLMVLAVIGCASRTYGPVTPANPEHSYRDPAIRLDDGTVVRVERGRGFLSDRLVVRHDDR